MIQFFWLFYLLLMWVGSRIHLGLVCAFGEQNPAPLAARRAQASLSSFDLALTDPRAVPSSLLWLLSITADAAHLVSPHSLAFLGGHLPRPSLKGLGCHGVFAVLDHPARLLWAILLDSPLAPHRPRRVETLRKHLECFLEVFLRGFCDCETPLTRLGKKPGKMLDVFVWNRSCEFNAVKLSFLGSHVQLSLGLLNRAFLSARLPNVPLGWASTMHRRMATFAAPWKTGSRVWEQTCLQLCYFVWTQLGLDSPTTAPILRLVAEPTSGSLPWRHVSSPSSFGHLSWLWDSQGLLRPSVLEQTEWLQGMATEDQSLLQEDAPSEETSRSRHQPSDHFVRSCLETDRAWSRQTMWRCREWFLKSPADPRQDLQVWWQSWATSCLREVLLPVQQATWTDLNVLLLGTQRIPAWSGEAWHQDPQWDHRMATS